MSRVFLACLLLLACSAFADVFGRPLTAETKPALLQSLTVLTTSPLTVGEFKQVRTIKKLNREFVSTGFFAIDRQSGIVWDTRKPFATVFWVGDDAMVQLDPARNTKKTVSVKENPVFAEFSKTIQSVFSGNYGELERNFKIYFEKKGDAFTVGLVPKESAVVRVVASIVLEGTKELDKVKITDGDGNPVVYEFSAHGHFQDLESVDGAYRDIAQMFSKLKAK